MLRVCFAASGHGWLPMSDVAMNFGLLPKNPEVKYRSSVCDPQLKYRWIMQQEMIPNTQQVYLCVLQEEKLNFWVLFTGLVNLSLISFCKCCGKSLNSELVLEKSQVMKMCNFSYCCQEWLNLLYGFGWVFYLCIYLLMFFHQFTQNMKRTFTLIPKKKLHFKSCNLHSLHTGII